MPNRVRTAEEVEVLANGYRLLRSTVVLAVAYQMIVGWAIPCLISGSSDQLASLFREAADESGRSATYVRLFIGAWSLVVGLGHIAGFARPRLQRFFGAAHAIVCVVIGVRLMQIGFIGGGQTYAVAWAALGAVISITAERGAGRRRG